MSLLSQVINPVIKNGLGNPSGRGAAIASTLISNLITVGFIIGVLVFFIYFIMGAIHWITSAGDKGKAQTARDQLTQAVFGLVTLFLLFVVLNIIHLIFGIDLMRLEIPTP